MKSDHKQRIKNKILALLSKFEGFRRWCVILYQTVLWASSIVRIVKLWLSEGRFMRLPSGGVGVGGTKYGSVLRQLQPEDPTDTFCVLRTHLNPKLKMTTVNNFRINAAPFNKT
jgi:hypothetical protein